MTEYFIVSNSFAAPFCSDKEEKYVKGESPLLALKDYVKKYFHPCGLFFAALYKSADDFHKGKNSLAYYLCNFEAEKIKRTRNLSCYSFLHDQDNAGEFMKIDDKKYYVDEPRKGKCYEGQLK